METKKLSDGLARIGYDELEHCELTNGNFIDAVRALEGRLEAAERELAEYKLVQRTYHDAVQRAADAETRVRDLEACCKHETNAYHGLTVEFRELDRNYRISLENLEMVREESETLQQERDTLQSSYADVQVVLSNVSAHRDHLEQRRGELLTELQEAREDSETANVGWWRMTGERDDALDKLDQIRGLLYEKPQPTSLAAVYVEPRRQR